MMQIETACLEQQLKNKLFVFSVPKTDNQKSMLEKQTN